jgi:mannose/fructose/N-acetylgalactosamine-specific phosphotransferase system component IIC
MINNERVCGTMAKVTLTALAAIGLGVALVELVRQKTKRPFTEG